MRTPEYNVGDRVGHFREPGNVGKVVSVERRGLFRTRWVYWVRWRHGVAPVPLSHGLWLIRQGTLGEIRGEVA